MGTESSRKAVPNVYSGVPPVPSNSCPKMKTYKKLESEELEEEQLVLFLAITQVSLEGEK